MTPEDLVSAGLPAVTDHRLQTIGAAFSQCGDADDLRCVLEALDPLEVLSLAAEVMWSRLAAAQDADVRAEAATAAKKGPFH
jgi:hypothetical protein